MTRIYCFTDDDSSDVTDGTDFNKDMIEAAAPSAVNHSASISASTVDEKTHTYTTQVGIPGVTTWPAGDYDAMVDVTQLGGDVTYKIAIGRVDSTGTLVETLGTSGVFNTTGFQTFTVVLAVDKVVAAADRFQVFTLVSRSASHGIQNFTVRIGDVNNPSVLVTPLGATRVANWIQTENS